MLAGCSLKAVKERIAFLCLQHQSPAIMNAAATLLSHSRVVSEPMDKPALQALKNVLPSFFAGSDPKARGDSLSIVKRLCNRLAVAIGRLRKAVSSSSPSSLQVQCSAGDDKVVQLQLGYHLEFGVWLQSFLQLELQPSASYQRHIASLKVLSFEAVRDFFVTCEVFQRFLCIERPLM